MTNDVMTFGTMQPTNPKVGEDLVQKIFERTIERKIQWEKTLEGHRGSTPDGKLVIELNASRSPVFGSSWSTFKVFRSGIEIFKTDFASGGLLFLSGFSDPLNLRVTKLFEYLESTSERQVEAALLDLDQL